MRKNIDLNRFKNILRSASRKSPTPKRRSAPPELDQSRVGRLSRMNALQQQAITQAAARFSAMEDQRIQTALQRMTSGEYGYCMHCEEKIAEARLRVETGENTVERTKADTGRQRFCCERARFQQ
jgi:DnaK suppressor protein